MKTFLRIVAILLIILSVVCIYMHNNEGAIIMLLYAVIFRTFILEK
jgi:4-hydroxybenzoate polyprenyltransferase